MMRESGCAVWVFALVGGLERVGFGIAENEERCRRCLGLAAYPIWSERLYGYEGTFGAVEFQG